MIEWFLYASALLASALLFFVLSIIWGGLVILAIIGVDNLVQDVLARRKLNSFDRR